MQPAHRLVALHHRLDQHRRLPGVAAQFHQVARHVIGEHLIDEVVHVHALLDVGHHARAGEGHEAQPEPTQDAIDPAGLLARLARRPVEVAGDEIVVHVVRHCPDDAVDRT